MLSSKDISELRKRMTLKDTNITRLAGIYVSNEKERMTSLNERFLNLPEEEVYKYLDIAKEVLNRKVEDRMLGLTISEESRTQKYALAEALESKLNPEQEQKLEDLYNLITENKAIAGNYLILLFYDVYDVPKVAADGKELEDSDEVYEYILGAICPVSLTAPGIEYDEATRAFKNRERDWVVQKPTEGFIWPAFENRTVEMERILFYTKDAKEPDHNLMELGFGTIPVLTATEERIKFEEMIFCATDSEGLTEKIEYKLADSIYKMLLDPGMEEKTLKPEEIKNLITEIGEAEVYADKIAEMYESEFKPAYPKAAHLLNERMLKRYEAYIQQEKYKNLLSKAQREIVSLAQGEFTEIAQEIEDLLKRA